MPDVLAIETYRLPEIAFQRDTEFTSIYALKEPPLLILIGGVEPTFLQRAVYELTASVLKLRMLHERPTWTLNAVPRASRPALEPVPEQLTIPGAEAPALLPEPVSLTDPQALVRANKDGKIGQTW